MIKISNIRQIVTWDNDNNNLLFYDNKSIYVKNNKITEISNFELPFDHEIDAKNTIITPGFIDCHTHPIFNENRSNECKSSCSNGGQNS